MATETSDPGARTMRAMEAYTDDPGILHLIVMGPNVFAMHPLPEQGTITIGRDESDDVRVDEANASRHHARLHVGPTLQVEDLGSTNGTLVRGVRLSPGQRVAVQPGEAISIGWATLMVQRRRPSARTRRLPTHAYFEVRLEEECLRAERTGGAFAMVRLHVAPGTAPDLVADVAGAVIGPDDVLALYGPNEYEILLFEPDRARAEAAAQSIVGVLAASRTAASSGLGMYPSDARSAEALIAEACARVLGREAPSAASSGAGAFGPEMRRLYTLATRAAAGNINVLILGETGVGKEVMAETIHQLSPRAGKPLLRLNCAAFSATLLESELFGHERAAFTGAHQAKPGLLETAQGGTVLLDEVGELPLPVQAKLLRVIETRRVLRVGALKPREIDVRFLAATNRVLEDEVDRKAFRQDLYYRLNGISLVIPPLRERREEIESLARSFLEQAAKMLGRPVPILTPPALRALHAYSWPGNIRELRNAMERALLLCEDDHLNLEHLPVDKMRGTVAAPAAPPARPTTMMAAVSTPRAALTKPASASAANTPSPALLDEHDHEERARIVDALARCQGNQTRAARLLGMPRRTFCARLKSYDIPRPRSV
ncbi:MAG TPA: sigma 54-interacting transcriptional regulator [Polyangia bacterium]|jgi:DNA-binding NtrC family response regulator|nr:sigma 54-interacting transcriptional regulator [Polyangia bacterium]